MKSIRSAIMLIVAMLVATLPASAQDCLGGQCAARVASVTVSVVTLPVRVVEYVVSDVQPVRTVVNATACSLAQSKAERQAAQGRCYHVGGGFGGGRAEGVGYSTVSADAAIRACCYWGKRSARDIGVARGRNGWYATVIYN